MNENTVTDANNDYPYRCDCWRVRSARMKKPWESPSIESESAFETLVSGCVMLPPPVGDQDCGGFPETS